nr:SPARC and WAP domain-containing protein [Crepidula fornicata]
MKKLAVLLLLCGVMAVGTEAGWLRKAFDKFVTKGGDIIQKVGDFVRNKLPAIVTAGQNALGQRSVRSVREARQTGSTASPQLERLIAQLQKSCPQFGIKPDDALTPKIIQGAFSNSDENKDNSLSEKELDIYQSILDTFEECVEIEKAKRK